MGLDVRSTDRHGATDKSRSWERKLLKSVGARYVGRPEPVNDSQHIAESFDSEPDPEPVIFRSDGFTLAEAQYMGLDWPSEEECDCFSCMTDR